MLRCHKAQSLLGPLLDGELAPRRERSVRAHLEGCAACSAELESLERLREALAARIEAEVAEVDLGRLWSGIQRGISQPAARTPLFERLRIWLGELSTTARALWVAGAVTCAVLLALVTPALLLRTSPVDHVSIESIEGSDPEDGTPTSTAIYKVSDGKGGTTTVIWVTEPDRKDAN